MNRDTVTSREARGCEDGEDLLRRLEPLIESVVVQFTRDRTTAEELGAAEIARRLGLPAATVRTRLRRLPAPAALARDRLLRAAPSLVVVSATERLRPGARRAAP